MNILNKGLFEYVLTVLCLFIVLCNGCLEQKAVISDMIFKEQAVIVKDPAGQGTGYLKEGSTVSLGIFDEEEELKVLDKVKKLEKKLNTEVKKRKTLAQYMFDLNTAKDKVEKELADTKKKHDENNMNLSEQIKSLEAQKLDLEERTIIAEEETERLKKDILKIKISETKVKQELFKYKIKQLEDTEEE